jgi:hypothetical protein
MSLELITVLRSTVATQKRQKYDIYYFLYTKKLTTTRIASSYTQKNFRNACYQIGFCTGGISTLAIQVL